jgi:hypothetical protein
MMSVSQHKTDKTLKKEKHANCETKVRSYVEVKKNLGDDDSNRTKETTTSLAHGFNSSGYRTYWQEDTVHSITYCLT